MKQPKLTLLLIAIMVAALTPAIFLQHGMIGKLRTNPEIYRDSLYLPAPKYVKLMSLGYDNFAADFFWLRAIQTFGATYAHKENLAQLGSYFDVITDLDPQFMDAYSFGNLVLGEEAGDKQRGLALLDKGIENNPRRQRLAYEAAFFAYWQMNNADLARRYVRIALKCPDHPAWLSSWVSFFEMKMGRYQAGYENYFRDYAKFWNINNPDLSRMREISMRRCMDDWYTAELRARAIDYQKAHGAFPLIEDLNREQAFKDSQMPDNAILQKVLNAYAEQNEKFPESYEELSALMAKTIHAGWTKLPDNPASLNPNFPNYLLWPGQPPLKPKSGSMDLEDNTYFAISEVRVAKLLYDQVMFIKSTVEAKRKADPAYSCPANLNELLTTDFTELYQPPWGGKWNWDPATCEFTIDSKPNLMSDFRTYPML